MKGDFVTNGENLDINSSARIEAGVQQPKWTDKRWKCDVVTQKGSETLLHGHKKRSYHEPGAIGLSGQDFSILMFKYLVQTNNLFLVSIPLREQVPRECDSILSQISCCMT